MSTLHYCAGACACALASVTVPKYTSSNRAGPKEALRECALTRHAPLRNRCLDTQQPHGSRRNVTLWSHLISSGTTFANTGSLSMNSSSLSSPRYFM